MIPDTRFLEYRGKYSGIYQQINLVTGTGNGLIHPQAQAPIPK
jgi:hypothetical protein